MPHSKIPLEEQLRKASGGFIVFPEYAACSIRIWAKTPLSAYLGGSTETGEERRRRFRELLQTSPEKEGTMTYRDAAMLVSSRLRNKTQKQQALQAARILAEPLAEAYGKWKEAWENAKKNPP